MRVRRGARARGTVWTLLALAGLCVLSAVVTAEEPAGLVDWLEAHGRDASFAARCSLFEARFPGAAYGGTAEQNLRLLAALKEGGAPVSAPRGPGAQPPRHVATVQFGWRVVLDRSAQVLGLQMPTDIDWEGHILLGEPAVTTREPVLQATLPRPQGLIPAAVLAQKAKQFDDGLYATVEQATHGGHGAFPGKRRLLSELAERLTLGDGGDPRSVAAVVHAARALGQGWTSDRAPKIEGLLARVLEAFDADEKRSKPLGFYTWWPWLGTTFRQDRMLQTPLARDASLEALVGALRADAQASAAYRSWLQLVEGLTNPFPDDDLRGLLSGEEPMSRAVYFLPPSRSHETELGKRLWGNKRIPAGASLVDALVERVRAGTLPLEPRTDAGWYDHQSWALEPLLRPDHTPEAKHLRFDAGYRAYLEQLFRALLALTRETHVKQVECPSLGAWMPPPRITILPSLTVEPLATHYLRRADAYRFVRGVLTRAFGEGSLRTLCRLTARGPVAVDLATELTFMERLFRGAAECTLREIGSSEARPDADAAADLAAFDAWRTVLPHDPDLGRDARMMVPVFYDVERKKTKVWVFLGWSDRPLSIQFVEQPRVVSWERLWPGTKGKPDIVFSPQHARVAYPVSAEVYVTKLLNREEFRAHCDRHEIRSAILENLR